MRAKVIGLGGLHLAARDVAGVVVADVARLEPLVGQHLRYGGGQSIDVGVVDHVDGGFIWRVSQLLGLAFVLVVQQAGHPLLHLARVHPHHALHAVVAPAGFLEDRDGGERHAARGQFLQLLDEIHDVPTVGQHHGTLDGAL